MQNHKSVIIRRIHCLTWSGRLSRGGAKGTRTPDLLVAKAWPARPGPSARAERGASDALDLLRSAGGGTPGVRTDGSWVLCQHFPSEVTGCGVRLASVYPPRSDQVDFDQNLARRRNQVRIMRSTAVDFARRLEAYDPDSCSSHGPISGVLDLKAASDVAVVVLNDLHPTRLNRCRGAARSNAHFQKEESPHQKERGSTSLRAQASAASTSILTRTTSNRPGRLTGSSQLWV